MMRPSGLDPLFQLTRAMHGQLALAALALLAHPILLLFKQRRHRAWSPVLGPVWLTTTGVLGFLAYPVYRSELKLALFRHSARLGWAFERKEHLAIAAILASWAGYFFYRQWRESGGCRQRRLALSLYLLACAATAGAYGLGLRVVWATG